MKVDAIREALLPSNAIALLRPYDIILDCTDNAPTRYLLSDAAVILEKPLVSGAAQKYDGQLCTYNYKNGPCYRCLFPIPPLAAIPASCEETGILGPVTGIIGNMQALETIKILVGLHGGYMISHIAGASQGTSHIHICRWPTIATTVFRPERSTFPKR